MTYLAWMTRLHISFTEYLVGASVTTLIFGLLGTWALWRMRKALAVLPALENRVSTLSNSVSLLTDTTEACYKALGAQLQIVQARPAAAKPLRKNPARRIQVAAPAVLASRARLGTTAGQRADVIREIADALGESERAPRSKGSRDQEPADPADRYGSLFS